MTSERRKILREAAQSLPYLHEALDALDEAERKLDAMHAESDKRDDEIDRDAWRRGMWDAVRIARDFHKTTAADAIEAKIKEHADGN